MVIWIFEGAFKGQVRKSDSALLKSESDNKTTIYSQNKYSPRVNGVEQNVLDPDTWTETPQAYSLHPFSKWSWLNRVNHAQLAKKTMKKGSRQ